MDDTKILREERRSLKVNTLLENTEIKGGEVRL